MASIVTALKVPTLRFKNPLQRGENAAPEKATDPNEARISDGLVERVIARMAHGRETSTGWRIPLIGGLPFSKQIETLASVIALLLLLTLGTFGISIWDTRVRREQALVSNDLQLRSLRLAHLAQQAVTGDPSAFEELVETRERLDADLSLLSKGGSHGGFDIPAPTAEEESTLVGVAEMWRSIDGQVQKVLGQQTNLLELRRHEELIEQSGGPILKLSQSLQQGAIDRGEDFRATAWVRQLYADVVNFELLDATSLLSTDRPTPQVALQLGKNVGSFTATIKGLLEGSPETGISPLQHPLNRDIAKDLLRTITSLKLSVDTIVRNMEGLARAKQASRDISQGTHNMLGQLSLLTEHYRDAGAGWGKVAAGLLSTMLTLLGLALIAKVLLDDARARALKTATESRRNEEAILRLLDDMSDLAEGDLTKHAQVTEDMTGAIADAVNYAIDELRSLVTQINTAATKLTQSSTQGKAVSGHLLQVAEKQSRQIEEATTSVLQMTSSMDAVSSDAAKCADVATQSLQASGKGGSAVQESIASMNELREQIQETSKRIKRLGESSQEIGEIVQLIATITEQTNVLALNAAIQAAAAGEAGRGFTVVAEEVQRLAERSGEATKQIGAIVKAIQHDTQDAVAAMEKSTNGVVRGAQLADSAGRALEEIGDVSRRLADLIASISSATLAQQQLAQQMAQRMRELSSVTTQSTKGSRWTADSMAQIADLADHLRVSVAGFKV